MLAYTILRLREAISEVCPIQDVGGQEGDVQIKFDQAATETEKKNAQAVVIAFDWSDSATKTWRENKNPEKAGLIAAAQNAVTNNEEFLAMQQPTNAEAIKQIRRLTSQNNRIIKRLVQIT